MLHLRYRPCGIGRLRTVSNSTANDTYTNDRMGALIQSDQAD